jgi:membrane peptidoglycan carboxypeptidase
MRQRRSAGGPPNGRAQALRPPAPPRPRRRRAGLALSTAKRQRSRKRTALKIVLVLIAVFSAMGLAGVGAVYAIYQNFRGSLPDAAQLALMEPQSDTRVYDRGGNLIGILRGDTRHVHVKLADISRWARLATVDVEDRQFYSEASWNLQRIIKSGWDDLRTGSNSQGASTITQQLAKLSFLDVEDRSVTRKAKQVILGIEIENNFSKDQILEMYMNRIDYGNHSLGVEAAAETYFHKSAKDLDLAEASMLAVIPNSPYYLDPNRHDSTQTVNPASKDRQKVVLQAMVSVGDVTQAQADAAYAEPLTFHYFTDSEPPYTNFIDFVKKYLEAKFGDAFLNPGGWEVHTSLDPHLQDLAQQTVHDEVAANGNRFNMHDGALVSMDPQTGEVLAMVGAWDPNDPNIGEVPLATSRLQPGSTIKLFTYTAAIASRQFTMHTPILDAPLHLKQSDGRIYSPLNYDRSWHGTCELQVCFGNSFNIPAVKVEAAVGIPYITDLEIAAGLTSLAAPDNRPAADSYAATLGALHYGVTPLELANGVSTLADLGVHHDVAPVLTITNRGDGKVIYSHDAAAESQRVIPANAAFITAAITSNDANRVREFGAHGLLTLPDRKVSAKTGTTEDFSSNWTVGFTPQLVSVVVVANPTPNCLNPADVGKPGVDPNQFYTPQDLPRGLKPVTTPCGPLNGVASGITGAAPIWNKYMRAALKGVKPTWYDKPADLLQQGTGDGAYYYLPGTTAGYQDGKCYHYGPAPEPGDKCIYNGGSPYVAPPAPPATPKPSGTPAPSGAPASPASPAATPAPPGPPAPPSPPPGGTPAPGG